jgi:hypothetical protein
VALAKSFPILDGDPILDGEVKNPSTQRWDRAFKIFNLLLWQDRLQVQAGVRVHPLGGHRVDIPLPQQQVVLARNLDLMPVVRTEQHPVAEFHRAHMVTDGQHLGPD